MIHTTLGRSEVLARSRGTRAGTTSLFDAQSAAFDLLTLEAFFGSVSLVGGDHFDEAKATRLLGMRITHDLALLNLAVFFKKPSYLGLGEAGVDARDEEVGAGVDGTVIITALRSGIILGSTDSKN